MALVSGLPRMLVRGRPFFIKDGRMTQFQDMIAQDGFNSLLLLHGETVPIRIDVGSGWVDRTGIVDRNVGETFDAAGNAIAIACTVRFADSSEGVEQHTVNQSVSKVRLAVRRGGTVTDRPVYQVLSADAGVTVLLVR